MKNDKFSVLYRISMALIIHNEIQTIDSSDIVSITIIHNYDTMTYPIIRIRLYPDISVMQNMTEYPDEIYIRSNLDAGVYKMSDNEQSPTMVYPATNMSFKMKVYIENKNIPTSTMDQYENGIKKTSDLNSDVKVPIELYCYNEQLIHRMKQQPQSIYKDMSLTSVIQDAFLRNHINEYSIDPLHNQKKFHQILIPNLDILQMMTFFDSYYGLYKKGSQVYGDIDKMYVCNTDVSRLTNRNIMTIYVQGYQNNSDTGGVMKYNGRYIPVTKANNVSILSESDIERVLNSEYIGAINVNQATIQTAQLKELYQDNPTQLESIMTSNILHKYDNQYVVDMVAARITEKMTKIDVSGVGFDIGSMHINTLYGLSFESPIRGSKIANAYRATYIIHNISNLGSDLFVANTTMNLCTN